MFKRLLELYKAYYKENGKQLFSISPDRKFKEYSSSCWNLGNKKKMDLCLEQMNNGEFLEYIIPHGLIGPWFGDFLGNVLSFQQL